MLTRWAAAPMTLAAAATVMALAQLAYADGPNSGASGCQKFVCVEVEVPGKPAGKPGGSVGGQAGGSSGSASNEPVCTYKKLEPQPAPESILWEGHAPGDGAVYQRECNGGHEGATIGTIWASTVPGPTIGDPAVLAQRALDKMLLRGPEIGITPEPGGEGVVGMPVYLWTERGPETFGPNTASASAGGVTVVATANVLKIVWTMGDGKSVTCTTPGTPYKAEYGKRPSPDCGHRYSTPSSTTTSGKFHVTATSTWTIDWTASSGQTGQLTEVRTSSVDVTVAEVQVLN
ncbi:ATP/GTP-binding protein [Streptomyces sp. NPDC001927]